MVYAGPVFWDLENARTVMQEFLPGAPEEFGPFVGFPPIEPLPAEPSGQARLRHHRLLQWSDRWPGGHGRVTWLAHPCSNR
jgi:hypothetical protein